MESSFFLSIVMPVYNVEYYLRDAVSSVTRQTYTNFELILVDDCSTDDSLRICDELAARDTRIRVIHKPENQGLSMARNTGIDAATGDYIYFMDSDDVIEASLFADVAKALQEYPVQAVLFGMLEEYFDKSGMLKSTYSLTYPKIMITRQEQLRAEVIHIESATLYGYACNKFYNLKYLNQIGLRFKKITLIEDIQFNIDFFMDATSLCCLDSAPYHYKKRGKDSLTAQFVYNYFQLHTRRVQLIKEQYLYWNAYTKMVRSILGVIYSRYIYSALQRNCDHRAHMRHEDRKRWIKTLLDSELYQDVIPVANAQGRIIMSMIHILQSKHLFLILAAGRLIYIVNTKMPMLFVRAKQNR